MIILDLDGVLADFNTAAALAHDKTPVEPKEWDWYKTEWGMDSATFWEGIHRLGPMFYGVLVRPYPWLQQVLDIVGDDFVVMTSPSNHPHGYSGKKLWVDKYLPKGTRLIVGSDKHLLAQPGRLLIDDNADNCARFRQHGGQSHVFRQPWNTTRNCSLHRMMFLTGTVEDFRNAKRNKSSQLRGEGEA